MNSFLFLFFVFCFFLFLNFLNTLRTQHSALRLTLTLSTHPLSSRHTHLPSKNFHLTLFGFTRDCTASLATNKLLSG